MQSSTSATFFLVLLLLATVLFAFSNAFILADGQQHHGEHVERPREGAAEDKQTHQLEVVSTYADLLRRVRRGLPNNRDPYCMSLRNNCCTEKSYCCPHFSCALCMKRQYCPLPE